jgi:hypothetical protein
VTVVCVVLLCVALPTWAQRVKTRDRMTWLEVLAFAVTVGAAFGLVGSLVAS